MVEAISRVNVIVDFPREKCQNCCNLLGHVAEVAQEILNRTESEEVHFFDTYELFESALCDELPFGRDREIRVGGALMEKCVPVARDILKSVGFTAEVDQEITVSFNEGLISLIRAR